MRFALVNDSNPESELVGDIMNNKKHQTQNSIKNNNLSENTKTLPEYFHSYVNRNKRIYTVNGEHTTGQQISEQNADTVALYIREIMHIIAVISFITFSFQFFLFESSGASIFLGTIIGIVGTEIVLKQFPKWISPKNKNTGYFIFALMTATFIGQICAFFPVLHGIYIIVLCSVIGVLALVLFILGDFNEIEKIVMVFIVGLFIYGILRHALILDTKGMTEKTTVNPVAQSETQPTQASSYTMFGIELK